MGESCWTEITTCISFFFFLCPRLALTSDIIMTNQYLQKRQLLLDLIR